MADALKYGDLRVARVCAFWENLSPATLASLATVYHDDTRFTDPFNSLHGAAALHTLLTRMFERLDEPRFVIVEVAPQDHGAFLVWDFHYRLRDWQATRARLIHGVSHVRFGADGRVVSHRDYWDAASQVYEQLPLLGGVLRWLKHRIG